MIKLEYFEFCNCNSAEEENYCNCTLLFNFKLAKSKMCSISWQKTIGSLSAAVSCQRSSFSWRRPSSKNVRAFTVTELTNMAGFNNVAQPYMVTQQIPDVSDDRPAVHHERSRASSISIKQIFMKPHFIFYSW